MNSVLNYITWNPDIVAFHIFGLDFRYYSLMWGIGLLLAYEVVRRLYKDQSIDEKKFDPLFMYCFFGILIGARLGHCLFYDPTYYASHLLEVFLPIEFTATGIKITGFRGLASHGGTLGLMIALWLYVRKTKVNILTVLDNIAIATPITAFFIRLGNFFNSEIVGKYSNSDFGVVFAANGDIAPRYPAQLYEAIAYLLFFFIGIYLYKKKRKQLQKGFFFGLCLTLIFTFRFFVEFLKAPQEAFEETMLLNMGQLLSIPFVLLGTYCMIGSQWLRNKGEEKQK
ncbi:MAG: prolipoprotein diacylglyceryl transferase [Bacteroidaceae bacterium]|nr:prolipoprotein diacylglyceryl transferase [Bacteroidaceae bacterium]